MDRSHARIIYSLTTDRQPVIYWARNHLLARLFFDSNTQETTKRQVYPSDFSSFLPFMKRNPAKNFDCNRGICMYMHNFLMHGNDITPSNVMEIKTEITKMVRAAIFCRIIHCNFPLPLLTLYVRIANIAPYRLNIYSRTSMARTPFVP